MNLNILNSKFNILFHNNKYVYNSKNGGIIELPQSGKLTEEEVSFLEETGFIVKNNQKEINDLIAETNVFLNSEIQELEVTIQITEECNFKCIYCYQKRTPKKIDFNDINYLVSTFEELLKKNDFKKINIHYFGGEPLVRKDLTRKLHYSFLDLSNKYDIPYFAYLTTNGSLLNKSIVQEISFEKIKLTLEGLKDTHNKLRVSNHFDFDFIIKKVEEIIPYIKILQIRINLCEENKNELKELLEFIYDKFTLYKDRIKIDLSQMIKYNEMDPFTQLDLAEFSKYSILTRKILKEKGVKLILPKRLKSNCPFLYNRAICISPNLKTMYCTGSSLVNKDTINSEFFNKVNNFKISKKCEKCNILPLCLGGCPVRESTTSSPCISEKYNIKNILELIIEE